MIKEALFKLQIGKARAKFFSLEADAQVPGFCGEAVICDYEPSSARRYNRTNTTSWDYNTSIAHISVKVANAKDGAIKVLSHMLEYSYRHIVSFADRVRSGSGLGKLLIDPLTDGEILDLGLIKWKVSKMAPFTNPNTRVLCHRVELIRQPPPPKKKEKK